MALAARCAERGQRVIGCGKNARAELRFIAARPTPDGQYLKFDAFGKSHEIPLPLIGDFQGMNALAKAIEALRPYAKRKLVVVFGAGGDRDAGKRPLMGAIAAQGADTVIVTDDNPRGENPSAIRAAILAEAKGAKEIGDRAQAIRAAITQLQPGDALLIAGKGHETGQIIGDKVLPFSDHEAAIAALAEHAA